MNINIKELVSNPFFCPFNIDSYNLLNNHQFRQLDHSTLEKISSELEIAITSDWLTIDGLCRTLDTFCIIRLMLTTHSRHRDHHSGDVDHPLYL